MSDLMRVSGIGQEFSELLEAAGVDTVKELRNRNADNLAAKMAEVNAQKK
ncbi:MAG: nucleotidyltransferase/DNA polymerase involved in DNA repair [Gammaproteobacteria bacterium]|jgi:nucleotidyltransferase/DNA polymerase involved in DNA repair